MRTPEQIIGKDAVVQLLFEGYAVVPASRLRQLERIIYLHCDPMAMPDEDAAFVEQLADRLCETGNT